MTVAFILYVDLPIYKGRYDMVKRLFGIRVSWVGCQEAIKNY